MNSYFALDFLYSFDEKEKKARIDYICLNRLGSASNAIYSSIDELIDEISKADGKVILGVYDLEKFGIFALNWLDDHGFVPAYADDSKIWKQSKSMPIRSYKYVVGTNNLWYKLLVRISGKCYVEFRSLQRIVPLNNSEIKRTFLPPAQKRALDRKSKGKMKMLKYNAYAQAFAFNDMLDRGYESITIGACAIHEFYDGLQKKGLNASALFPFLGTRCRELADEKTTIDEYVRRSFTGGWIYCNEKYMGRVLKKGIVLDVQSLYPFCAHSKSGNLIPYGDKVFVLDWEREGRADAVSESQKWEDVAMFKDLSELEDCYFFVKVKAKLKIKPGKVPCIADPAYNLSSLSWISNTDDRFAGYDPGFIREVINKVNAQYERFGISEKVPKITDITNTFYLTQTDYELMHDSYHVYNEEIQSIVYFKAQSGLFDDFIDKHFLEKQHASTPGGRYISKMLLNHIIGKLATRTTAYSIRYEDLTKTEYKRYIIQERSKKTGYIPAAAAIISYARRFIVEAAQKNLGNLVYSDTDSLVLNCSLKEAREVTIGDGLGDWKLEHTIERALFIRKKQYIIQEKSTHNWCLTLAGIPEDTASILKLRLKNAYKRRHKKPLMRGIKKYYVSNISRLTEAQKNFLYEEKHKIRRKGSGNFEGAKSAGRRQDQRRNC